MISTVQTELDFPPTWHYPRLDGSESLRRVLRFLMDGQEHSTRQIDRGLDLCAINSWMAALKANGYPYYTEWRREPRRCVYWLPPETIEKARKYFEEREAACNAQASHI